MKLLYKTETKMVKEIVEYIKKGRSHGLADELMRSNLLGAGWPEQSIAESFASLDQQAPTAAITPPVQRKSRKKIWVAAAGLVILFMLAAAGGYIYYTRFYFSPDALWNEALMNAQEQTSGTLRFAATYQETIPDGELTMQAVGSGNFQKTDSADSASINAAITSDLADYNYEIEFEARKIDRQIYFKTVNNMVNPLSTGLAQPSFGQLGTWSHYDLGDDPDAGSGLQVLFQSIIALARAEILSAGQYLATEDIDGMAAAHYQIAIDRDRLAEYLENTGVESLAEKLSLDTVEIWIGKKDGLIRRMILQTNFPAFFGSRLGANLDRISAERDARRLADIRQIISDLSQYKSSVGTFPPGENGLPEFVGKSIPFAPKPADGSCTPEQNLYWYTSSPDGQDFELKFCLGSDTEGYAAGVHTATVAGIIPPAVQPSPIKFSDLPRTATLELDLTFSDYNRPQTIAAPEL